MVPKCASKMQSQLSHKALPVTLKMSCHKGDNNPRKQNSKFPLSPASYHEEVMIQRVEEGQMSASRQDTRHVITQNDIQMHS